ncbi:dnaK [Scenedesmus sp. PABB004]|nr:dnaK [Scenedesmus sp. PABB004]
MRGRAPARRGGAAAQGSQDRPSAAARPRPAAARRAAAGAQAAAGAEAPELVVGIDLGTTNSAVARIVDGAPVCIPNAHGDTLTPSVVAFLPGGGTRVGRAAKARGGGGGGDAATTYYSVKRLIGRPWADAAVQGEAARLAYTVAADSEGATVLACPHVPPGCLYPEEVSGCVVAQLLDDARAATGAAAVTKAVITVPAYFDDAQRDATVAAGRLAGLETVRLVREPVAAALAYGLDLAEEQVVLVFDLGGGTFDISLLEVGNGTIEVLSTGGDAHLGGDDWDAAIVDWLRSRYLDPAGVDSSAPALAAKLKALAEYAKVSLSDAPAVTLRMPVGGPGGGPLMVTLDQATLDELSADLFRRARLPLDQACWAAGVDLNELQMSLAAKKEELARKGVPQWKQELLKLEIRPRARAAVSKVLLVGGATRMPAVRRFITNMTGLVPVGLEEGGVDPDEAVALGAAVQAGILQGQVEGLMVMDQWQASLMRALATLQLRSSPEAVARVRAQFDMDADGADGAAAAPPPTGAGGGAAALTAPPGSPLSRQRAAAPRAGSKKSGQASTGRTALHLDQSMSAAGMFALPALPGGKPGAAAAGFSPFAGECAQQQPALCGVGSISPPASSCSTGTALGGASGGAAAAPASRATSGTPASGGAGSAGSAAGGRGSGVASMMPGHAGAAAAAGCGHAACAPGGGPGTAPGSGGPREWLYRLVTFPSYFTPCVGCCNGARTPKREQLMTLFDTKAPHKVFCSHCPECQLNGTGSLLQVRRASFKDVVKATDIVRFGADIGGVQQYTLNGSKVIYLNREAAAEKKPNNGTAAPAQCTVDGRAMMDKSSLYCSLKCKMHAEDPGFNAWLDAQDPSVRILADIAANAPPRPTVACKRAAAPTSSGSSGSLTDSGSAGGSGAASTGAAPPRPRKAPRTTSSDAAVGAAAGAPAGQGSGGESAAPGAGGASPRGKGARAPRARAPAQRAASAPGPAVADAPAGLKPIRTSLAGGGAPRAAPARRQGSAPSAFLAAALAEPALGPPLGGVTGSSWLAGPAELDNALSSSGGEAAAWESWGSWEGGMASPALGALAHDGDAWQADGSLSPALVPAPHGGALAAGGATMLPSLGGAGLPGMEDWWLPTSPSAVFAPAGPPGF